MIGDFIRYNQRKEIGFNNPYDLVLQLIFSAAVWYMKYLKQLNIIIKESEKELEKSIKNRELQARIISGQAETYIWDKADEMGVALEVEVETRDLGSGPYPWRATLTGTCGGEKRTALTRYIEENLAIPEARQVWQCE